MTTTITATRGAYANLKVYYYFVRGGLIVRRNYADFYGSTLLNEAILLVTLSGGPIPAKGRWIDYQLSFKLDRYAID
jgi:hypothetical protein